METIVFDIETGPLPQSELAAVMPPFDPAEVKTGNIKDPEKVAAKIAEAQANHRRDFFENAALDPLTGRVLAIGISEGAPHPAPSPPAPLPSDGRGWRRTLPSAERGEFKIIGHDDEAQLLQEFWELTQGEMGRMKALVGFNICGFDLSFLIRRSWKHRVPVPLGLRRGRYWGDHVIDLRERWQLGDRQARGALDTVAKHLGVGAKTGEGKEFAKLWLTDRKRAEEYLRNDVELTVKVADALGVDLGA